MQVIVNGLATNYQRIGTGKSILILHGWGDSSAGWQAFAESLSTRYEVLTIDLPGFGKTQEPPKVWGLNDYAAFVGAFLYKIAIEPYVIIGHSNGGAIAIRGLANGSLHAERLELLASAGIRGEYKGRYKTLRLVVKAGKVATMPLPARFKKKLQRKVYDTVGSDMLVAENLQDTFKRVITDDVRADAAKLTLPTLLVYGVNDKATPPRYGDLFQAAIKGSRLEIVPAAEHFVHLDAPAAVLALTEEFLT